MVRDSAMRSSRRSTSSGDRLREARRSFMSARMIGEGVIFWIANHSLKSDPFLFEPSDLVKEAAPSRPFFPPRPLRPGPRVDPYFQDRSRFEIGAREAAPTEGVPAGRA